MAANHSIKDNESSLLTLAVTTSANTLNDSLNDTMTLSNETSAPTLQLPDTLRNVFFTIRIIWAILAISGNLLTIIAVAKCKVLQKKSNLLICSLAVADLFLAVGAPLELVHQLYPRHPLYVIVCTIDKLLNMTCLRGNYCFICLIAIDRFLMVSFPLKYPLYCTNTKMFTLIGTVWLYILLGNPLVVAFESNLEIGIPCKFLIFLSRSVLFNYFIPEFFLALIITVICYSIIAYIAKQQKKKILAENLPANSPEALLLKSQNKITRMMLTVVASYVITYIFQLGAGTLLRIKPSLITMAIDRCSLMVFYMNSWLNPIIYGWQNKDFRDSFKKLLCRNRLTTQVYPLPT